MRGRSGTPHDSIPTCKTCRYGTLCRLTFEWAQGIGEHVVRSVRTALDGGIAHFAASQRRAGTQRLRQLISPRISGITATRRPPSHELEAACWKCRPRGRRPLPASARRFSSQRDRLDGPQRHAIRAAPSRPAPSREKTQSQTGAPNRRLRRTVEPRPFRKKALGNR